MPTKAGKNNKKRGASSEALQAAAENASKYVKTHRSKQRYCNDALLFIYWTVVQYLTAVDKSGDSSKEAQDLLQKLRQCLQKISMVDKDRQTKSYGHFYSLAAKYIANQPVLDDISMSWPEEPPSPPKRKSRTLTTKTDAQVNQERIDLIVQKAQKKIDGINGKATSIQDQDLSFPVISKHSAICAENLNSELNLTPIIDAVMGQDPESDAFFKSLEDEGETLSL